MNRDISIRGVEQVHVLGFNDENLRIIEQNFDSNIVVRGSTIKLNGDKDDVNMVEKVFSELISMATKNTMVTPADVNTVIKLVKNNGGHQTSREGNGERIERSAILYTKDGTISPKSDGQRQFYDAAYKSDIVFAIGPAGTGKTYLAVAIAVAHLRERIVGKIILARPAVEAGESLGYLPGDLLDKVHPYLKPLYDALFDMMLPSKLKKYMDSNIIEVVPLAYMRGRTLNNAFVILDEAQNTSPNQMKMFLTRLGINSKAIITGDTTQVDLPANITSGLIQIQEILTGIDGIDFVYLTNQDVVRHKLVREIIKAYDRYDENQHK
ncbi:PhoH family protein [candidate division KSB1 bacterium]|nr:PhoH family protein [candidate division KSB1 bacterium]